jgi:DNA-binding beta-propeller fold protein YncE
MQRSNSVSGAVACLLTAAACCFGPPAQALVYTNLFVADHFLFTPQPKATNSVLRYNGANGAFESIFIQPNSGGLRQPLGMVYGPDRNFYVTDEASTVRRYRDWGDFYDVFVPSGSGGLDRPMGIAIGPTGNLYVTSYQTNNALGDAIKVFSGASGTFLSNLDLGVGSGGTNGLDGPVALIFGPDTNLYVSSFNNSAIMRYSGLTGAPMPAPGMSGAFFVTNGLGGLSDPYGLVFSPDGQYLLVGSGATQEIKRYDTNGAFVDTFATLTGGASLPIPYDLAYGPDGNLYVSDTANDRVVRFRGSDGAYIDDFVPFQEGGLMNPRELLFAVIPEPSTSVLAMVALNAAILSRRRRRRR